MNGIVTTDAGDERSSRTDDRVDKLEDQLYALFHPSLATTMHTVLHLPRAIPKSSVSEPDAAPELSYKTLQIKIRAMRRAVTSRERLAVQTLVGETRVQLKKVFDLIETQERTTLNDPTAPSTPPGAPQSPRGRQPAAVDILHGEAAVLENADVQRPALPAAAAPRSSLKSDDVATPPPAADHPRPWRGSFAAVGPTLVAALTGIGVTAGCIVLSLYVLPAMLAPALFWSSFALGPLVGASVGHGLRRWSRNKAPSGEANNYHGNQ